VVFKGVRYHVVQILTLTTVIPGRKPIALLAAASHIPSKHSESIVSESVGKTKEISALHGSLETVSEYGECWALAVVPMKL
jgi:hypothetical protein